MRNLKIENKKDWIEIEFLQYAKENEYMIQGLIDEKNCVEIVFNFNIENDGWGCVGDEFFYTKDIKEIAEGFIKVLLGICDSFNYSAGYPYECLTPPPFYTFDIKRKQENVTFVLTIHDRLSDYISVTEKMPISKFEHITNEFKIAAKQFSVK